MESTLPFCLTPRALPICPIGFVGWDSRFAASQKLSSFGIAIFDQVEISKNDHLPLQKLRQDQRFTNGGLMTNSNQQITSSAFLT